jgi:excisionase family DNA binding protein
MPGSQSPSLDAHVAAIFGGRLVLSINETAEALRVDRDTVYTLASAKRLTLSKIGRRSVIHVHSILKLLADTVVVPAPRADDEKRIRLLDLSPKELSAQEQARSRTAKQQPAKRQAKKLGKRAS